MLPYLSPLNKQKAMLKRRPTHCYSLFKPLWNRFLSILPGKNNDRKIKSYDKIHKSFYIYWNSPAYEIVFYSNHFSSIHREMPFTEWFSFNLFIIVWILWRFHVICKAYTRSLYQKTAFQRILKYLPQWNMYANIPQ